LSHAFSYFLDRVLHLFFCVGSALDYNPPTYTSLIDGHHGVCHTSDLFVEVGISLTPLPGLMLSCNLPK
jgi:hypothetical protein